MPVSKISENSSLNVKSVAALAVKRVEGAEILMLRLKKTCRKLGVSFWEYLKDRVSGKNAIPTLGTLIANKAIESQCPLAENSSLCLP